MTDLVNERYKRDVAFYRQEIDKLNEEIKKIDEKITEIGILAWQTTDDRVYNAEIKQLEIKREALKSSLENCKKISEVILKDRSQYDEIIKREQEIF